MFPIQARSWGGGAEGVLWSGASLAAIGSLWGKGELINLLAESNVLLLKSLMVQRWSLRGRNGHELGGIHRGHRRTDPLRSLQSCDELAPRLRLRRSLRPRRRRRASWLSGKVLTTRVHGCSVPVRVGAL